MTVYERFLKYVSYPTTSDENVETCPSTSGQMVLAKELCKELFELGLTDARVCEHGYVYASIPANCEGMPSIGFIAHMDTASEASGENIKPKMIEYKGGDILLNESEGIYLTLSDYPYVADLAGQRLIVTDGTTLLGADDKAGVAEIITAVEKILNSDIKHGKICIGFTPDEEIGRGADLFDVAGFGADFAYTLDGGPLPEIEYENFNAASAVVKVHGKAIHPGSAKDKMKNASLIACEFNSLLPKNEIPAKTEGYEGFFHLLSMSGEIELAKMSYIIRDHDMKKFTARKELFLNAVDRMNEIYGEGTLVAEVKDTYYNMREKIEPCMYIVERAKRAMLDEGVTPIITPIRGGTDGSKLSFLGLPCPNLSTGARNCHSRFEFVSANDMEKMTDVLVRIIKNAVADGRT